MLMDTLEQFSRYACMLPFGIDVEQIDPRRIGSGVTQPYGADDVTGDAANPQIILTDAEAVRLGTPPVGHRSRGRSQAIREARFHDRLLRSAFDRIAQHLH